MIKLFQLIQNQQEMRSVTMRREVELYEELRRLNALIRQSPAVDFAGSFGTSGEWCQKFLYES